MTYGGGIGGNVLCLVPEPNCQAVLAIPNLTERLM
jgi:hypothetical protein